MFWYMCKTAWEKIFPSKDSEKDIPIPIEDDSKTDDSTGGLSMTTIYIVLGAVFCLCNFFVIFAAVQWYRYQSGASPTKAKRPKVSTGILSVEQI